MNFHCIFFGLNLHLKKRIVKTMVWSFEMWVWRRMEKISWTEKVSNDEIWRIVGEERMLIKT